MKISHAWLRELCPHEGDSPSIADRLTDAGLEVEGIEPAAQVLDGVVVARILSAEKHPDADRLQVCQVDAGQDEPLQIVCGAPNARAGLVTALATIGTRLPGDFKIKKSKIRGVASFGMLCAAGELGLAGSDGIIELDTTLEPGSTITDALELDDHIFDIGLTPNRGDCLSALGIARELAAMQLGTLNAPSITAAIATHNEQRSIAVTDSADCSWYCGRVIRNLDGGQPTPMWMLERLRRSGLGSNGPIVDVTNYVLLELGQPLHSFDQDALDGDIQVRRAQVGETLKLLNDQELNLCDEDLLICDASGPVALAGAMGGASTAVHPQTRHIFLESACFSPKALAGVGRRYKLNSDALHRFERGTDPALPERALERATELLISICGGEAGPISQAGGAVTQRPPITFSLANCNAILGSGLNLEQIQKLLNRLGCRCTARGEDELQVEAPSWRPDLAIAEDLMEEVARLVGYQHLGGQPQAITAQFIAPTAERANLRRAQDFMRARGWSELVSFSFCSRDQATAISGQDCPPELALANPLSDQLAVMRPSLLSSMLPLYVHNLRQSNRELALFETGRNFSLDTDARIQEIEQIAGVCGGHRQPESWHDKRAERDFYDLRGLIEDLATLAGAESLGFVRNEHPALHPGQCAQVFRGETAIGHIGRLHPNSWKKFGGNGTAPLVFEIERLALLNPAAQELHPVPQYPASRRDLSFIVSSDVYADDLMSYIRTNTKLPLADVVVFDVFASDSLADGCKSIAFGLIFQDFSRTLKDGDIDDAVALLVEGLYATYKARLRD